MVHLWSGYTAASVLVISAVALQTHAANVVFKNQCEYAIDVYDNSNICTVSPGSRASPSFGCGREIPGTTMYRHKENPEATLAEFAYGSGKAWYDISIIPPGPDNCGSLSDCQQHTGKTGFNVPVMILPTKYLDAAEFRCRRIMCHYDGCPDAFHFPKDNDKVYNCPQDEQFHVIYCP